MLTDNNEKQNKMTTEEIKKQKKKIKKEMDKKILELNNIGQEMMIEDLLEFIKNY